MRPADLLRQYCEHINPPYSHRDAISVFGTLFLLLAIPLTTILATQGGERVGGAQLAVKAQTISEVEVSRSESLSLFKLNRELSKAAPTRKGKILAEMVSASALRKARMKSLLEKNPKEVLKASFPKEIVAAFPAEIQKNLEQPVTVSGDLEVLTTDNFAKKEYETRYFLRSDKERFSLYPTKKLTAAKSGTKVEISGTKLDDKIVFEGVEGQDLKVLGTLTNTIGDQRTVVILVNFLNDTSQSFTTQSAASTVFTGANSVSSYYLDASYNKTWLTGDAYGWYTMAINKTCDYEAIETAAIDAADPFVNFQNYSRIILAFPGSGCGWAGLGTIGKWNVPTDDGVVQSSISWIIASYFNLFVVGHEFGHNLGVYHAGALDCGSVTLGDSCTTYEYGDRYDILGGYNAGHHSAARKQVLNWFVPANVVTASSSGNYTIEPLETNTSGTKAVKVPIDADYSFYLEFRQAIGKDSIFSGDANLLNGVLIRLVTTGFEDEETWLLDATPADEYWRSPALEVGNAFHDSVSGITITTLSKVAGNISVNIDLGTPTCQRADPTVALSPSSVWKDPGQTATYTLTITNNDSEICGSSTFDLTSTVPGGWSRSLIANELSINPGASSSTSFLVTSLLTTPQGSYDVSATAFNQADPSYDNTGSAVYMCTGDLEVPSVSITSPSAGATVTGTITVLANASDDVGVTQVKFKVDGTVKSTDTASPYNYSWDSALYPNGAHSLSAEAYDAAGHVTTSSTVSVTTDNLQVPPTVDIKANSSDGPITVSYNTAATLSWSSTNTTSCTASGAWSGTKATSGSQSSGNLTANAAFALTCTGLGGSASDSVTVNVSGQGTPTTKLGDLNSDGLVNIRDASILVSRWNTADPTADLNHDGVVNIRDASTLVSRWGT